MKKITGLVVLILLFAWQFINSYAVQRFPKPEFESGYITPQTLAPNPRAEALAILDVIVLIVSLSVISWLVIKKRSRNGVYWMSIFSLVYFGFYREGCICAVGSVQNITLALFDNSYVVPVTVLVFFALPLLFTLFVGRTFCAGVCPLGAIQDVIVLKPQKLDNRLNAVLGVIPYIYLGLSILYAATGTDFIICRYDPFVGIFRFDANFAMFLFGGTLLLSGIFIARPYCRFLCPYGVLLNWVSRFAKLHITITPSNCIQCRLCENSCPFDAIDMPITAKHPESRQTIVRKFLLICVLIPVFIITGGWTGSRIHESLSLVNSKVSLTKQLLLPSEKQKKDESVNIEAFKSSGKTINQLYAETQVLLRKFYIGGWILGGFVGLVIGVILAGLLITRYRTDYEPNKGTCFSCARCVDYCPVGKAG